MPRAQDQLRDVLQVEGQVSETAALRAFLSETAGTHPLAEMVGFVADRLMAPDVDQLCDAGAHVRNVDRVYRRNGYRSRAWEARAGTVGVKTPELRRAAEKTMTAVIHSPLPPATTRRSEGGPV